MTDKKVCKLCLQEKCKQYEFYKRQAICKECHAQRTKQWLRDNPGMSSEYSMKWLKANPQRRTLINKTYNDKWSKDE